MDAGLRLPAPPVWPMAVGDVGDDPIQKPMRKIGPEMDHIAVERRKARPSLCPEFAKRPNLSLSICGDISNEKNLVKLLEMQIVDAAMIQYLPLHLHIGWERNRAPVIHHCAALRCG